jgi:hypothetical protein
LTDPATRYSKQAYRLSLELAFDIMGPDLRETFRRRYEKKYGTGAPSTETVHYTERDCTGGTFLCDEYPCPDCGQNKVIGYYFVTEEGHHMHTYYVCTYWASGADPAGGPYKTTHRCGWSGWSIPTDEDGHDD